MGDNDQQWLADKVALADLVTDYALAVDKRDAAGLKALFTPAAVVVVPPELARPPGATRLSPDELLGSIDKFLRTRHVVEQQQVSIAHGAATGETYGQAHHLYRRDGVLRDTALILRYVDTFIRSELGWRFEQRELHVDWVIDNPVSQLSDRSPP